MLHIGAKWQVGIIQAHLPDKKPEIPPHPERVMEALLAAAWAMGGSERHRRALRFLEDRPPVISHTPSIAREGSTVTLRRYGAYIQDDNKNYFKNGCLFESHPVVVGGDLHAVYSYDISEDGDEAAAIRELLAEVYYLGETESAVTLKYIRAIPDGFITLVPSKIKGVGIAIRVPAKGRVDLLEGSYKRRVERAFHAMERGRADIAYRQWSEFREFNDLITLVSYVRKSDVVESNWHLRCAFFADGCDPNVGSADFDALLADCRSAWMDSLRVQVPELTGHEPDGAPTVKPHVALVPLLDIGRPYATGAMTGFGVLIPKVLPADLRREAESALARTINVRRSDCAVRLPIVDAETYRAARGRRPPTKTRMPQRMVRKSVSWATVTPVVPWRYGKSARDRKDPQAALPAIHEIFERAGLPQPIKVHWGPSSLFAGAAHAAVATKTLRTPDGKPLPRAMHLSFEFESPVCGPIVLGRRSWKGYGLCLPIT